LSDARGALTDARGALAGALEWLGDERAEVTQTRVERDAARADLARARARLVDLDGALAERDAALAVRDGVLAMREAGLLDLAGLRDALVAERVALFARIEVLEQARDEADGWVLRLARERHGLQRDVARGRRRIAALEQAAARGAAREQGLGEALARAKEQERGQAAALAAMEGTCAALREDLAQVRKVDDSAMIEAVREQAGRDLAERYGEIAALTLMLREQVEAARQREGEAAWLRGLWSAMERAPVWWNWVPGACGGGCAMGGWRGGGV
jgi:chromosome segregation ATPase